MVKIAIAGGSGGVAREVIDALIAANKHEITALSRNEQNGDIPGVKWRKVNYDDLNDLGEALQGHHTVLSFIQLLADPENRAQKNLINAAIIAGVKRFAPSEWGCAELVDTPWWAGKAEIREYLKKVNEKGKVLEYTLFQPGLFLDYLAFPYKIAKYVDPLNTMVDFQNRRAIVVNGHADDTIMTFTTVQDLATVVARAVDLTAEWPVIGGISGNRVTVSKILDIGEKIRGRPFVIDTVELGDLEKGDLKSSWSLETSHSSVAAEEAEKALKNVLIGMLVSSVKGGWDVSDAFNQLLPDYEFTQIEEFLAKVWEGKP